MMRHLVSSQLADFAGIYEEDVELISVTRPRSTAIETIAERLLAPPQALQAQWEQAAGAPDAAQAALSAATGHPSLPALSLEIADTSEVIGELLGCRRVGMRLTTLHGPMCPRFHVDRVPCRMLITLSGVGTEWIPSAEVDPALLADHTTDAPPLIPGGTIKQLTTTNWSLLKGGLWKEDYSGVVHRSPHHIGNRLLLTIDPIFAD